MFEAPTKIGKDSAHYHILEKIGESGMGVIYKATDTSLQRLVALKFLASNLASTEVERQRFVQEARASGVAGAQRPGVIRRPCRRVRGWQRSGGRS